MNAMNLIFRTFLCLILTLPALALTAQSADRAPTLREAPGGMNPQRHLLQTVYTTVTYPPTAAQAKRGGAYALAITVNDEGSSWEVMPPAELPDGVQPTNLIIKSPDKSQGGTISGQMKVNADRALLEETEKMGRYLVDIGFDPAIQGGGEVDDTLYLVFYYQIE